MFAYFENLLDPYPNEEPQAAPKTIPAFLWRMTEGCRGYFVAVALFTAMIGSFEAILFAFLGRVVDWLAAVPPAKLWQQHGTELALLAGVLALSTLFFSLQSLYKHQTIYGNFPMRLRWNFHRWMLSQSMSFYQDEFAGRIAAKVMQTAIAVRGVLVSFFEIAIYLIIYFSTVLGTVGSFSAVLLIPFVLWIISYCVMLVYFVPRIGKVGELQADARSLMTGRITDAYANIATVKLFSHHEREAQYAQESMQQFMKTAYPQMRLSTQFEIVNHVISMTLVISASWLALHLWSQGLFAVGAVTTAIAMAIRLNGLSHWIMWELANLFENLGTVRDGINTLSQARAITDASGAKPLQVTRGEITFENVDFGYKVDRPIFTSLNLTIKPGEKIALVGPSGAGKSTLTNLLLRFYDIQSGNISIDGQNIATITQQSLHANIAMVTQDTSLLHRSIAENLRYGKPDASDAAMLHAAKEAEAADFILGMEDLSGRKGFDAHVGERGVKLSGGQRQRIAIARVILKDAPILVLDEATSALDSEVEAAIQTSLNKLMQGKTVLAIAHRLSTIAAMDRLIVMDHGGIAEMGSHQELLAAGGLYARLWARQSGGFLGLDLDASADETSKQISA